MRRTNLALFLLSLLVVATIAVDTRAQAVYGSIAGTVTDSSGAVIPDATVTIRSIERNTSDTVQTNDAGVYLKDRLLPGVYEVKVEKPGYKQSILASVTVNLDTQASADVALEAGQVSETVTISTVEGQLLKTDRADVATTFESRQVTDLPILDRNFTKLILLTPGATQQQWQHAASENPQGSVQTVVNGQSFSGTGYQLDGTENRDPILGIIVINPNFDSVGETKITSQNYDAEHGMAIAGIASVQTKSGTNDIHGSAFLFRQNDEWQARNPFSEFQPNSITGKLLPDTLKNLFGGSIGGRIIRDKLFYFGDYQGVRSKVGRTRLTTLPTPAARAGDLRAYGRDIYDPLTGQQFRSLGNPGIPNGTLNVIPPAGAPGCGVTISCLSPQALNILSLLPPPNATGLESGTRNNFTASGSEVFDNDTFNIRIDGRISEQMNVFGRYSFGDFIRSGQPAYGIGGGPALGLLSGSSTVRNQSLALGLDRTLNDTTILDVRFGWFKYLVNVLPADFGTTPAAAAGIPNINLDDTFNSGLPQAEIQGDRGFRFGIGLGDDNGNCNCPLTEDEQQYQLVSNLTKLYGNHTLKFGVDIRKAFNLRVPSDTHRAGNLVFSDRRTSLAGVGGLGIATFLVGDVTFFERYVSPNTNARERQWRHFYYGQDTWRMTPKLTLAYGLRLDVINPQKVNEPGNAGFPDLSTGEILVAGVGGIPLSGGVENSLNFAPRLGVAYQLTPKTVLRAGYGRSYDIGVFGSVFGHTVTQNLPVLATQQLPGSGGFERVFNLAQGPPLFTNFFGLTAPPNQGGVPNASLPTSGRFFLPAGVRPRVQNSKIRLPTVDAYNVTLQHEWSNSISVEVAYVGNKGTHVFAGNNPDEQINQAPLAGFFPGRDTSAFRPFAQAFGWRQDVLLYCNCSDNHYDSLQAKLTKRFSDGYSINAHYTLQRARDWSEDRWIPDIRRDVAYGPQDFVRTHNFVLSQVAELPFGRGKKYLTSASRALDLLVGGWQFNSATMIQSGLPFNISYRNAGQDRDVGPNFPDIVGAVETGGSRDQFFTTTPIGASGSPFARPAPGTWGNAGRNRFHGPGYWRTDASLFKKFRLTETQELEFRIESVNVFNHVNLGQPDSEVGVPGNDNPNAGRITSTAYFGSDPMRNFQFAVRYKF
jgi:Carboxypeptidase regulatory-like domain/TonB dependent receptor